MIVFLGRPLVACWPKNAFGVDDDLSLTGPAVSSPVSRGGNSIRAELGQLFASAEADAGDCGGGDNAADQR